MESEAADAPQRVTRGVSREKLAAGGHDKSDGGQGQQEAC
jgi:hypothetical protein